MCLHFPKLFRTLIMQNLVYRMSAIVNLTSQQNCLTFHYLPGNASSENNVIDDWHHSHKLSVQGDYCCPNSACIFRSKFLLQPKTKERDRNPFQIEIQAMIVIFEKKECTLCNQQGLRIGREQLLWCTELYKDFERSILGGTK